ncbi:MAG: zinc-dependent metalloprotease [Verrucomicrobiota bacterium]
MKRELYAIIAIVLSVAIPFGFGCATQPAATTKDAAASKTVRASAASPKANSAKPKTAQKSDAKKTEKKPEDDKPFDEVVKDMEVLKGFFTFYRKADENKVLMEIRPDQIDKIFLFASSVDQSVGERGLYAAQMWNDFPFFFKRVGKNVQWIIKNPVFTAAPGSPAERATARSFPNSILGSARIQSQPHPERKSILINVADLFVADLPALAQALKEVYKPSEYRFDKSNSHVNAVKPFPENVLLEIALHYTSDNPRTPSITLPDARSIPMVVKYDLSTLKDTNYKPRLADDRVGHFITIQQDFTSDRPASPYRRYINRWHIEKKDPGAPLSPPKEPIVFWLENTIPVEYREWMKEGVLLWNKAFEKIGIKEAIVVKTQPDNADWDPADTRYNTIRWFAGVDASFAIGPSRANPFTGQIYDADIGFSEGIIRSVRRQAEEFVAPVAPASFENASPFAAALSRNGRFLCDYADGLAHQAAFGASVLDARGALTPELEQKLMREFIIEVTAHEVGHTLGLRHNFRASTILQDSELHDVSKTSELSQSASVMDYNPIVLAGKGEKQGHFVPITLGPYDYWAIEYAYKPINGDEAAELAKVASRSADPHLPYATDEDALGTYSAAAIDPLVNQFDQAADPLAYFRKRISIINELWTSMESKLARPGEGYQVLRRALGRGLNEYYRSLMTGSKFVGGVYHHRDHVGDPNGRPPYIPVAADKQREALEFLRRHAFSEQAFQLPPGVLNKLAAERLPSLAGIGGLFEVSRIDYPWHDSVLNMQRAVLDRLFSPITLARILDNELRFKPGEKPFTMADVFTGINDSIWSEVDQGPAVIPSLRRNLQREHLKRLIRLTLRSGNAPEDATTLARASLVQIRTSIEKALKNAALTDLTTRAHLQETEARIATALEAQMQKAIE